MKALVLEKDPEVQLVIRDVEKPGPGKGEALVRLKAAALNHRDQWIREGKYAKIQYPVIPGSDGCGIVEESSDPSLTGKEVIINPNINWGDNENAQGRDYSILGMPSNGTFAEYVCVPEDRLHLKPPHLSFEEAASLPLAGMTAYRTTMKRGKLRTGEKVLITGIGGGVAQWAAQFSRAAGATVFITSGEEAKIEEAKKKMDISGGISYKKENWHKDFVSAFGNMDLIIDSAGGEQLNLLLDIATSGGRIAFYGATLGTPSNLNLHKIFWKQLSLLGSTMGSDNDFREMLEFVNKHRLTPLIDSVRPFEQIISAYDEMKHGTQNGKLVVRM